jgi:hypothetical protein
LCSIISCTLCNHIYNFHFCCYHFRQFIVHDAVHRQSSPPPLLPPYSARFSRSIDAAVWGTAGSEQWSHQDRAGEPSGPSRKAVGAEQGCRRIRAGAPPMKVPPTSPAKLWGRIGKTGHPRWVLTWCSNNTLIVNYSKKYTNFPLPKIPPLIRGPSLPILLFFI